MSTPAVETTLYGGKVKIKFFPETHIYYVNGKRRGSVTGALGVIDKSRALIPWAIDLYAEFLRDKLGQPLTEEIIMAGTEVWSIKKTEAATIGTTAHDWIEQFVKGNKPDMPDDKNVIQAINGFMNWVEDHKVKFLMSEQVVYSKKHDYIGTMDAVATLQGGRKRYMIDYKVSNGLYPAVAYQTAAYLKADEEESGREYAGRWAIRLSKETEEEYMARQEKKLTNYLRKNTEKKPYQIKPYMAFEARFLDEGELKIERDFKAFLHALNLYQIHAGVDREFFNATLWVLRTKKPHALAAMGK